VCAGAIGGAIANFGVGAGTSIYDYATTTPTCEQSALGYLEAGLSGVIENPPFDPRWFGWKW
jgi:hypothetical protein